MEDGAEYTLKKRTVILSGINLFEGGPLSIYYDCLDAVIKSGIYKQNRIIAFVHKKAIFEKYEKYVRLVELPKSRKNYIYRLYYEYVYFYQISARFHADIWISLHDITPRVKAGKVYTYCHSPLPFMKKDIRNIRYSPGTVIFSYIYKYIYRINVKAAAAVIVQQEWMRREFFKRYPVKNVIVARPEISGNYKMTDRSGLNGNFIFLYAAYPRFFKNYEVILQAVSILEKQGVEKFEAWLTIDGSENRYSHELRERYHNLKNVRWLGLLPRDKLFEKYGQADCMIFPSTLETWGLPISEFKATGKPMILADLPYAHETLGAYEKAVFFEPEDSRQLVKLMKMAVKNELFFQPQKGMEIEEPSADNWTELVHILLDR